MQTAAAAGASNAPAMLFVHGFCCASDDWAAQIAGLGDAFRCHAFDLPGHGDAQSAGAPTMQSLGAAVNAAKDALPGDVVLVGHSLGCKIIREAYRQSEDRVAGLVFIDGSLYVGRRANIRAAAERAVDAQGMTAFLHDLVHGMFPESTDPALVARVWARAQTLDHAFMRSLFLDSVEWDLDQAVQTIREIGVPALTIQCTAFDTSFRWRSMRPDEETPFMSVVRTLAPQGRAVVLEGSGHFPMFDVPDALNAVLRDFVDRIAPA